MTSPNPYHPPRAVEAVDPDADAQREVVKRSPERVSRWMLVGSFGVVGFGMPAILFLASGAILMGGLALLLTLLAFSLVLLLDSDGTARSQSDE